MQLHARGRHRSMILEQLKKYSGSSIVKETASISEIKKNSFAFLWGGGDTCPPCYNVNEV